MRKVKISVIFSRLKTLPFRARMKNGRSSISLKETAGFSPRSFIVLGVVFLAALLFSCFLRQQYVVPIVMYHSVIPGADPGNRLAVTPQAFERQMRFLKTFGYNVVSLEKIAELIKNKKKIPARTVALTFDDGYKNIYTYAFPVLKKYRLPATAFIIVKEVGRPQNDRLSWDEIKEMRASGIFYIGSHCLGPEPLVNLKSEQELRDEIFGSKRILEEKLGSGAQSRCSTAAPGSRASSPPGPSM